MAGKAIFLVGLLAGLAAPLSANPENVAPDGWQRTDRGDLTIYQSQPPGEAMMFRTFAAGSDPAEKVALLTEVVTGQADSMVRSDLSTKGPLHIRDVEYVRRNVTLAGKIIAVRQSDGRVFTVAHFGEKSASGFAGRMEAAEQRMAALAAPAGAAPSPAVQARTASASPPAPVAAPSAGKGPKVDRVLFDLKYSYGVGGAMYPTYNLVALLADGKAARLGSYALDGIDVAAIGRKKRGHVGTWRRSGAQYAVRWGDGKSSELKTNVGPPAPLPSANILRGTYQAIGGGGNTALGGQVLTAEVKQFTFRSNGTFTQSSRKTASSGAGVGRAGFGNSGRWRLDGPNLTLSYGNGKVVRTSVFYSAKRKATAKGGRYGVIWIGGEDYQRKR